MAAVPSICRDPECGTIFFITRVNANTADRPAIIDIPDGAAGSIGMGNCPNCGKAGYIPAGRYELDYRDNGTDNPARFVKGPLSTKTIVDQARTLMDALRQSKTQRQAEVIAALETVSPTIAAISRQTADTTNYRDWINTILALLTLFVLIQQTYFKKEEKREETRGIKPEYVEMLIKENAERREKERTQIILRKVARPTIKQGAQASVESGNNKPCPCGSGKKFKHCHGRIHPHK